MAQMVKVRNTGAAAAMVNGQLLYEDEVAQVAAGLLAQLQADYPQLVVIGGDALVVADDSAATDEIVTAAPVVEEQPKAKAKKK